MKKIEQVILLSGRAIKKIWNSTFLIAMAIIAFISACNAIAKFLVDYIPIPYREYTEYASYLILLLIAINILVILYNQILPLFPKYKITVNYSKKYKVTIEKGDIFKQSDESVIIIPSETRFNISVGHNNFVASKSLMGKFITTLFPENSTDLESQISSSLNKQKIPKTPISPPPTEGNKHSYPLGTVAKIEMQNKSYALLAIGEVPSKHPDAINVETDHIKIFKALENFWNFSSKALSKPIVAFPLIGTSSFSNTGITEVESCLILIQAYKEAIKKRTASKEMKIIFLKDSLDIKKIKATVELIMKAEQED